MRFFLLVFVNIKIHGFFRFVDTGRGINSARKKLMQALVDIAKDTGDILSELKVSIRVNVSKYLINHLKLNS